MNKFSSKIVQKSTPWRLGIIHIFKIAKKKRFQYWYIYIYLCKLIYLGQNKYSLEMKHLLGNIHILIKKLLILISTNFSKYHVNICILFFLYVYYVYLLVGYFYLYIYLSIMSIYLSIFYIYLFIMSIYSHNQNDPELIDS